jgi:pimeloyl-ACP methyl ester carboxylesterase
MEGNMKKAFILLLLLAGLSACAGPGTKSALQLKPCTMHGSQARCGTLQVYENRAARSGRIISLNIIVIKAGGEHPAPDPIFWLSGGPGGAATEDARMSRPIPNSLSENHDLVFVDQRGTGGSNEFLIPDDAPDLNGLTPEQMDTEIRAWVDGMLGEIDMDPRYYTTSQAMDDLDEVRAALGYDKINLVGYSYGATAAQYYLRQHEEHVRSVVLGGGSLLDVPVFERWAQNSQRALDRTFELCLSDPACRAAYPDLRAEYAGLMERLQENPKTVPYTDPAGQQPASITFTADYLAAEIRYMMKDAQTAVRLPLLIHRAYADDNWDGFLTFFLMHGGPEWWGNQFMDHVIRCSEKWAAFDPAVVAQLGKGSPFAGWDLNLAQTTAFACKYTPPGITPEGQADQPASPVPVLTWNGDVDPIDPPENMAGAGELWPNSLSVVAPYTSHNFSDSAAISCWNALVSDFIQAGTAEGLDTSCLQRIQAPVFLTPNQ